MPPTTGASFQAMRYAVHSDNADNAENADNEDYQEEPESNLSVADSAQSADTAQSGDSDDSADVTSRDQPRRNTCECGAALTRQSSIDRGICARCWSER